ncbi:MAG: hypothetical protein RMK19_01480 [Bacteroidia bacterium]|nr:hypothetical protein [Bacteroidia bacterium]MDW8014666.1 hypothetical protein [Bacteroidia bacterium]
MEPVRLTRIRRLSEQSSASLALTAYLPLPPESATLSPETLQKLREKAEKAILKHPDRKEAESFRTNLDYALGQITEASPPGTWILAATPTLAEALFLPFVWKEEIFIGKSLKVEPALYALYRTTTVFVALASEHTTRWFEGIGDRLFPISLPPSVKEALSQLQKARQQVQNAPADTSPYSELFTQMARSAYHMALVKYTEILRSIVLFYLHEENVPVILMGDEWLLEGISKDMEGERALTLISGIPETSSVEILQSHVQQHLLHQRQVLEQMYYPFLAYSEAQSPQEIWTLLQDSLPTSPVLFVEEGYSFSASELLGKKKGLPSEDGVDLLVALVREKGGTVLFLPSGRLPQPLMLLLP